jgi:FAD-dependent oxidoreductase domain-containing protein 1
MPETYDVVIVGGAAMGSSLAYRLMADPGFRGRVLVIEKDPTYRRSASALSAASIRQQFSSPVNIRISFFGIRFLREIGERLAVDGERPDIALREGGYLYLASEAGAQVLEENQVLQAREGADIQLFTWQTLPDRFPGSTRTTSPAGPGAARARAGSTAGVSCRPSARRRARSGPSIGPAA